MPKSYLPNEPGAQRAERNRFDPYLQTYNRLLALHQIGHSVSKVEIIVLGGTWSFYPPVYQIWFIKECFRALNEFNGQKTPKRSGRKEEAALGQLQTQHKKNETTSVRCVGLVIETRPDYVSQKEVVRLRKLGCTKVQIGIQSLNDQVLSKNKRGHNVTETAKAIKLLRLAGFKIHAHWMANLYGSSVKQDKQDYIKLFSDPDFKPDELKIYPCSLITGTELMDYHHKKIWKPYTHRQLLSVLKFAFLNTPQYCRLTRVIRDIPSPDIVVGNKKTNFRQIVEQELAKQGKKSVDIRAREIRSGKFQISNLQLDEVRYETSIGQEVFLQFVTPKNEIVAFLRLSLPLEKPFIRELQNSAVIREVHVYGPALKVGGKDEGKAQHSGLGGRLIVRAQQIAQQEKYEKLSVISAVGTRQYYRGKGFEDGQLYQHKCDL